MKKFTLWLTLLICLIHSPTVLAGNATVVPLYSANVDAQTIGNLTSLITSEVDFSGRYDMVGQVDSRPSTLNSNCLKSISCLNKIASSNGATSMVVGSVYKKGLHWNSTW